MAPEGTGGFNVRDIHPLERALVQDFGLDADQLHRLSVCLLPGALDD